MDPSTRGNDRPGILGLIALLVGINPTLSPATAALLVAITVVGSLVIPARRSSRA